MYTPLLTLCVVAYNEEKYLERIFSDIYRQTYPKKCIDFILVDSMSSDRTKEMLEEFAVQHRDEYSDIRVFENQKVTVPHGLNVALENASGEVFLRIDAHAKLPEDFIEKEITALDGRDACGGKRPCITDSDTGWANTLLLAEESLFGSSIAAYRKSEKPSTAKSLFHGAYRIDAMKKVGFYDERLPRTEDNNMSYRLRKAGVELYYDPSIISYQYMRPDFKRMLKQKFANGNWIAITTGICPECLMYYHFVPFLFVCAILLTAVLCAFSVTLPAIILWIMYALAAMVMSVTAVMSSKRKSLSCILLPFLFLLLHISYGVGSFAGFFKLIFKRKKYTDPALSGGYIK